MSQEKFADAIDSHQVYISEIENGKKILSLPVLYKVARYFDLSELQSYLCANPDVGDVMQETGGIRKVRWSLSGKGKSGGVRVVYLDIVLPRKKGGLDPP